MKSTVIFLGLLVAVLLIATPSEVNGDVTGNNFDHPNGGQVINKK